MIHYGVSNESSVLPSIHYMGVPNESSVVHPNMEYLMKDELLLFCAVHRVPSASDVTESAGPTVVKKGTVSISKSTAACEAEVFRLQSGYCDINVLAWC